MRYPVAMAADPTGRWLYVVGANFDLAHRGGVVTVLDTATGTWQDAGRVEVPAYAAGMTLQADATGPGRHRLYIPAREDDSVTLVDVIPGAGGAAPTLDCGQPSGDIGPCGSAWRVGGVKSSDLNVGQDPTAAIVEPGRAGADTLLHVAASIGGRVATFSLQPAEGGGVEATALPAFVPTGATSPSALVRSPLSGRVYAADVRRNLVFPYELEATVGAEDTTWTVAQHNGIALPVASGTEYGRSLAFSADGGRLYVAYRNPNALLVIDTAPAASGAPNDRLVDTIGLGGRPAQVALAPTGPGGRELAYVSCFGTDDIWVVDPTTRAVVAVVRLPHSPYGLSIADVPGRGWTLYTGLFSQHRIAVVNLDEGDSDRHQVSEYIQ